MSFIKKYISKNLFYISVIITGITSLLFGIFYTLFKANIFENASNDFLEGTGVLSSYITTTTSKPASANYFMIGLIISLLFFFIVSLFLNLYLKKSYFKMFNLLAPLNIILVIGLVFACLFINISSVFSYIILFILTILYLFIFYQTLDKLFNFKLKQKIISLLIFIGPIILILILLKLFV